MKNIHAFVWSMEIYKTESPNVQGTWSVIQVIFELGEELMKILGLPLRKENSMYSAYWVSGNKKVLNRFIPDEVILDSCKIELDKTERKSIDGATYIDGTYGLEVREFLNYSKEDPDIRIYDVDEDSARENTSYIDRFHGHNDRGGSYVAGVKELRENEINLSDQAKLYLVCLVGRSLLWDGRDYMFRVLQYTKEQKEKEIKELLEFQVSWVDALCDYFGVPKDLPILTPIREMLGIEPKTYE